MAIQIPKIVFFDMDDTILHDMSMAPQCSEQACRQFVGGVGGGDVGTLVAPIESAREWYCSDLERNQKERLDLFMTRRDIVSLAFSNLGIDSGETANALADTYTTLKEQVIEVIPGVIETPQHLWANGTGLVLITNGHAVPQRAKIERFGLEPFSTIFGSRGSSARGSRTIGYTNVPWNFSMRRRRRP